MTPIAGGVFAAGGFANEMFSEVAGTGNTTLSQWLRLAPDPLGRAYSCLVARISQTDYYVPGGQNKYRSEAATNYQVLSWGSTYTYHWRFIVPRDWFSLGATGDVIVIQMHDVNAGAVGRQPTFAGRIEDEMLNLVFARDSVPSGETVYSTPVSAGQEFEITIQVHWADGTNEADANGFLRIYDGDALAYSLAGRNTWDGTAITEPNPPYLKVGVYQPGPAFAWWDGKAATMFYPAALVVAGVQEPSAIRQWIDASLLSNGNLPVAQL